MLYHFARFTKWPKDAFTDSDTPVRICVLGQDPFGSDLDSLVSHQIRGRDIVTTRLRNRSALAKFAVARARAGFWMELPKCL